MAEFKDHIKSADWKSEKHMPVIECQEKVKADEFFDVTISIGKEVAHPNTTEHHIRWVELYFHPDGVGAPYQLGVFQFTAHGESTEGPNKGGVFTNHCVVTSIKVNNSGHLHALSYCNIHGLWESTKQITVE